MAFLQEAVIDTYIVYKIISILVKDWDEQDAYKLGIIDNKGKVLKKAKEVKGDAAQKSEGKPDSGDSPNDGQKKVAKPIAAGDQVEMSDASSSSPEQLLSTPSHVSSAPEKTSGSASSQSRGVDEGGGGGEKVVEGKEREVEGEGGEGAEG